MHSRKVSADIERVVATVAIGLDPSARDVECVIAPFAICGHFIRGEVECVGISAAVEC